MIPLSLKHRAFRRARLSVPFQNIKRLYYGIARPASPGSVLEMNILKFLPRPTESEIPGLGPTNLCEQPLQVILMHTQV